MSFQIIKNAELPSLRNTYPFPEMEVGDAFDAPASLRVKVANAAHSWGRENGKKFSTRKMSATEVRCFRVA